MMQQANTPPRGFTLGELLVVLLILSVTAAVCFPVVTNCGMSKERMQRNQCMGNLKQIGLAALAYAQDNDGTLPPVGVEVPQSRYRFREMWMRLWLGKNQVVIPDRTPVFSLEEGSLFPYLKSQCLISCPEPAASGSSATYLVNDLCGSARSDAFVCPAKTVMATDGDGMFPVTGHSLGDPRKRFQRWNSNAEQYLPGCGSLDGITRHSGGACYLSADGHARWNKPEAIFFPPRESTSKTHRDLQIGKSIGPDPGGDMTYAGRKYAATFHLR